MRKILGLGNALTDILIQVSEDELKTCGFPKGSMQLVDQEKSVFLQNFFSDRPKSMVAGGSASNTINGVACLGGSAAFIGKVGADEVGAFYTADTKHNGVTPLLLTSPTTPSGNCTVLITPDGERTMCTFLGAACEIEAADITPNHFTGYDILHVEGYIVLNRPLITAAMKMAKAAGLTISLDLASYNVVAENFDFLQELVANYVDIVFANELEAHAFTGQTPQEALHAIAERCAIAVVKVGKEGSFIKCADKVVNVAAIKANSIDTTGAGDLYAAGFLFALAHEFPLEKAGELAALVSGNVVEVVGPKLAAETWRKIKTTF